MNMLPLRLQLDLRKLNFLATARKGDNSIFNLAHNDAEFTSLCNKYNFSNDLNCYSKTMQLHFDAHINSIQ